MKVKIIRMTEDPIDAIASAFAITRGLSYDEYLVKYDTDEKKKSFILKCHDSGHMSGLEFVDIDIEILGCSRVFEVDKVRSRIASYEVEAGQFTEARDFETVIPPEYKDYHPEVLEARIDTIRGWNEDDKANGIDSRCRRYWTHQGLSRRMRSKQNFRALVETGWLRICSTAQWEYRLFMKLLKIELNKIDPFLASMLVPKCKKLGYCPEVWEGCGLMISKKRLMELAQKGLRVEEVSGGDNK